ncbi:ABC transporter substrate-binding protein, partial [Klebsiella pneumoniae]|nr:ABC transporter substrate-binding protein [Klebsiella pneumoniae]
AFDFEWTNSNLFYGAYTRSNSYFSNSEMAAKELPTPAELEILEAVRDQVPPEVFTQVYRAPTTDGSGRNRAQLREALG